MTSNVNVTIPPLGTPTTAAVRQNFTFIKSEIEALQDLRNNAGQIKANYDSTLVLINFTANTVKTFDLISAVATLSSSPTTTFPVAGLTQSYADMFDTLRGSSPNGRLIENPIMGQCHLWRIQGNYSNKAQAQVGQLKIRIRNPVSGFIYDSSIVLADGVTSDTFNTVLISIADNASIPSPNGYVLEAFTSFTDTDFTVSITSITRISNAFDDYV